jgi:hypothetical protein
MDEEDDEIEKGHKHPHILRSCIKLTPDRELDIPRLSYWFVSEHGLSDFQAHMEDPVSNPDGYNPEDTEDFFDYMDEQNWCTLIKTLIYTPDEAVDKEGMTFDEFAEWLRCFHVIRPIELSKQDDDHPGNQSLVHWLHMMESSGISCASKDDIIHKKTMRMYSCTCSMYYHYMVCKHVLLFYLESGIVTKLPKGKKSLIERKTGRKRKAKGGEALTQGTR